MELPCNAVLLTAAVGGIGLLVVLYWLYSFAVAPFRVLARCGIRGPPPSPFYGNYKDVVKMGRLKFKEEMLKRHGKVFGYYIGQRPSVVITDLNVLKEVTVKQFDIFRDRPPVPDFLRKKSGTPRGIINARGDYWKKVRVILSPTFTTGKMKVMAPLVVERCMTLLNIMEQSANTEESVEVNHLFGNLTMEVIIAVAFGRVINIQRGERDELVDAIKTIFTNVSEGQQLSAARIGLLTSNFPCIVPLIRYVASRSKTAAAYETMHNLALTLIKIRRKSQGEHKYKDFLQLMMDATAEDRTEQMRLSDEEILSQCFVFMAAGYDTTSNTLTFTAYLLALNPDIQEKLIDEIKDYTAEHPDDSEYDTAKNIVYLDMVVQESLRLYPAAPQTVRHTSETVTIEGVQIPKGAVVDIPIWHIHHNADYWPKPEKFNPERFTSEEKAKRPAMAHMPFGWGPRNCLGMRFALMETKLALLLILRKYKFVRIPETEVPVQVRVGITMSPKNGVFLKIANHSS